MAGVCLLLFAMFGLGMLPLKFVRPERKIVAVVTAPRYESAFFVGKVHELLQR